MHPFSLFVDTTTTDYAVDVWVWRALKIDTRSINLALNCKKRLAAYTLPYRTFTYYSLYFKPDGCIFLIIWFATISVGSIHLSRFAPPQLGQCLLPQLWCWWCTWLHALLLHLSRWTPISLVWHLLSLLKTFWLYPLYWFTDGWLNIFVCNNRFIWSLLCWPIL